MRPETNRKGLTLIEVLCATFVLVIIIIGTAGYRYYAALDVRRAEKETTAVRIALLLNESWRGILGDDSITTVNDTIPSLGNPSIIDITKFTSGPAAPAEFIVPNGAYYKVVADNTTYFVTMSYRDDPAWAIDPYVSTHVCRALNIIVGWPITQQETTYNTTDYRLFTITTYVERF